MHTHDHRWMTAGTNEPSETTKVLRLTHIPRQAEMLKVARHPSKTTVRDGLTTREVAVTVGTVGEMTSRQHDVLPKRKRP